MCNENKILIDLRLYKERDIYVELIKEKKKSQLTNTHFKEQDKLTNYYNFFLDNYG